MQTTKALFICDLPAAAWPPSGNYFTGVKEM
jgi:hypothetical protein